MSTEQIMIGTAAFLAFYVLTRLFLSRKRQPNTVDIELRKILTDDQFKVKGRVAARADMGDQ